MNPQEKFDLITKDLQEVVGTEELKELLKERSPKSTGELLQREDPILDILFQ